MLKSNILKQIDDLKTLLSLLNPDQIEKAALKIIQALENGNTIFFAGNGGSAADAQHLAAEFVGRFLRARNGLPAIALTTDTSALTAIANDFGYDQVFSRQLDALGKSGDVFVGISTSGNSKNVITAIEIAKQKQIQVIAFTGNKGGNMAELADIHLNIPTPVTARIQECHILMGHIICDLADEHFAS